MPAALRFQTRLQRSGIRCYWSEANNGDSRGDKFDNVNGIIDEWVTSLDPQRFSTLTAAVIVKFVPKSIMFTHLTYRNSLHCSPSDPNQLTLIARGPTLKWKWVVVSVSAPLEIVDVTGQYDFQQHKQHHMESLRFEWKGGLVRRIRDES
ncbi:hypothetical protein V8E54_002208 [Elaphomyces granulatus]|jgi:hypothetical protein